MCAAYCLFSMSQRGESIVVKTYHNFFFLFFTSQEFHLCEPLDLISHMGCRTYFPQVKINVLFVLLQLFNLKDH